jgi:alpha-N-arabinofuranosidase
LGLRRQFTPEDYATEYRRYTAWIPGYGTRLQLVGSGPNAGELNWTRGFFGKAGGSLNNMWGWALHHYSWNASAGRTTDWAAGKRDALRFDAEQFYEILHEANLMEGLITSHWGVMGEVDRRHHVKLVVDEWGAWYAPGTEPFPEALLGQQSTMRDAVLSGLTLDTFQRHADKVAMANAAQLVNCLHSLFFAHEDKFCVTPTYHVFAMYAAHQGAQSLRTLISAPQVSYSRNSQPATLPGLAGSASMDGKRLTLTVTNQSLEAAREAEIAVRGAAVTSAKAVALGESDVHAHNSFETPDAVAPKDHAVAVRGGVVVCRFPAASVTKVEMTLA